MSVKGAMVVVLLMLMTGLAGCPSTKVTFPAVTESAAELRLPGKFVWFDLYSTDMTACENFYEALFGWDFRRTNDYVPRVKTVFSASRPIANMIGREAKPGDSRWLPYMSTTNVAATTELAVDNGGELRLKPGSMPDRGQVAVVVDPQGAAFGLVSSPIGDPPDGQPSPSMWLGAELWTTDVKGAVRFYQAVAGYDVKTVMVHDKVEYRVLSVKGRRRGGMVAIPWKGMKPEWVPYIAVADVADVVKRVPGLGGKVLIKPDMSVREGRLAMIQDPSGAVFGVHQIH